MQNINISALRTDLIEDIESHTGVNKETISNELVYVGKLDYSHIDEWHLFEWDGMRIRVTYTDRGRFLSYVEENDNDPEA